ncbi:MAG: hypothetical protein ACOY0T_38750 [Myxococcota bacterium]
MKFERMPPMPAKSRLSWQIARLSLDTSGRFWFATGVKFDRVAIIPLPLREEASSEEAWLASIEAAFEENAWSAFDGPGPTATQNGRRFVAKR